VLRIVRVLAPNPSVCTHEGTNTWIVGEGPSAVIDPGPDDEDHLPRVARDAGELSVILITHDHPDHAEGAARLSEMTGAPVASYRPAGDGTRIRDGEELKVGGARIKAAYTPGHSPDHMVFFVPQVSALFTGDAVMGTGTSVIDPPEGDLAQYLRSLRKMEELRPRVIYPGHGQVVFDAQAKLEEYLTHRAEREQQVLAALEDGLSTIADMVLEIYEECPEEVRPLAARSVLAHLLKLEHEGRVARFHEDDLEHWEIAEGRFCERCGAPVSGRARLCERCSVDALQERPEPAVLEDWPGPGRPSAEQATAESELESEESVELEAEPRPELDLGVEPEVEWDVQPGPEDDAEDQGPPEEVGSLEEQFSALWENGEAATEAATESAAEDKPSRPKRKKKRRPRTA